MATILNWNSEVVS